MGLKNLFLLLLKGYLGFYGTLAFVLGFFSMAGIIPAKLNEINYFGFKGLIIYVTFAPFIALMLAVTS